MITLLIMSNGRYGYLRQALASTRFLFGAISKIILNDDKNSGFTKAMITAWEKLKEDENEWVFHLEEDFVIKEPIYLDEMVKIMEVNPHLKQLVLLREGIVAKHPERYEDKGDRLEHRVGWSCNPCLYRKSLIYKYPWPDVENSERAYGKLLLRDKETRFAYWGTKPMVEHIGIERTGFGY